MTDTAIDLESPLGTDKRGPCRYFTHYGNSGVPGECSQGATLWLFCYPDIYVCEHHAYVITLRYPELGGVAERFVPL